jgi:hypothetical protein
MNAQIHGGQIKLKNVQETNLANKNLGSVHVYSALNSAKLNLHVY